MDSGAVPSKRIGLAAVFSWLMVIFAEPAQAQVPTINIQETCRAAAGVMTNIGIGGAGANDVQICLDSENKAREQIVKEWATFQRSDREGCIQTGVYLPSYIEWLTCFEMNKFAREARQQGRGVTGLLNADSSMTLPPVSSLGIIAGGYRASAASAPPAGTAVAQPTPRQLAGVAAQAAPVQSAAPQPAPAQTAQREPQSDELRQTNERLQTQLASSTARIAELEKEKAELETAIKQSDRARGDLERERGAIENAKGVAEETRIAEESKFNNTLARLEAEKSDAIAKVRMWQLVASGSLIVLLLTISGSLLLRRRKGANPAT